VAGCAAGRDPRPRSTCAPVGGGEQRIIASAPSGYRLAADVVVDIDLAEDAIRRAGDLLVQRRHQKVVELTEPVCRMSGGQLLAGGDVDWLNPHSRAVDALTLRGLELFVEAAGVTGEHDRAIAAAHQAVAADGLNEWAHRGLWH
jgi:hypothetical protein